MDNAIQVFSYEGSTVRTVEKDGEVWFVAKDVCDVLGVANARDAVSALDSDEVSSVGISDGSQIRHMNAINEPGLYALVLRSNKPEAKAFSRRVRHEVLPAIRKTGSYSVPQETPALPSGVIEGARIIFETAGIKDNQAAIALDKIYKSYTGRSAIQVGEIALEAPTKRQLLNPTEIGRQFGIKAHVVNNILAGAGWQHKIGEKWEPLEPGMEYAVMLDTGKPHSDGTPIRQLKWDSSILEVFGDLMSEEDCA